jgi:hypothetical protein
LPGPAGSGGPYSFLWDPSHFFGRNISVFWAKYLCFSGKVPKFAWYGKKLGKVSRKQLKRTCPENFFPKKLSPGRVGGGGGGGGGGRYCPKKVSGKIGNRGPRNKFAPSPRKALGGPAKKGNPTLACNRGLYITFNHIYFFHTNKDQAFSCRLLPFLYLRSMGIACEAIACLSIKIILNRQP